MRNFANVCEGRFTNGENGGGCIERRDDYQIDI